MYHRFHATKDITLEKQDDAATCTYRCGNNTCMSRVSMAQNQKEELHVRQLVRQGEECQSCEKREKGVKIQKS